MTYVCDNNTAVERGKNVSATRECILVSCDKMCFRVLINLIISLIKFIECCLSLRTRSNGFLLLGTINWLFCGRFMEHLHIARNYSTTTKYFYFRLTIESWKLSRIRPIGPTLANIHMKFKLKSKHSK